MAKQGDSIAAYSRHRKREGLRGHNRRTIYDAKAKGWLILFDDGSVNREASDRRWAKMSKTSAQLDDERRAVEDAAEAMSYQEARTRLTAAQAELAEYKASEEAGRLVDGDEEERAGFEAGRRCAAAVLAIPAQLCDEFAASTDRRQIRARLTDALREAMREVTEDADG